MPKVYGYTICQPSSVSTEKLKGMLYRPVLGYATADAAIQNAQRIFSKVSNITSQPQKHSVAVYAVDSEKIPDFKPFPKIYNITEEIRNQLNIEEHATYTPSDVPGEYIVNRTTDTESVRQEIEAGRETIEQRKQEEEREIQERLEKMRQEQERKAQERIAQQERERLPENAVGIKLVPMEQAAQPGWTPEQSPSDIDVWVSATRYIKISENTVFGKDDNALYTCAKMLLDLKQQQELKQKTDIYNAIHKENMRPIDAYEKYGQPPRYTMPALAVLYDVNKQPISIYMPSWTEVQKYAVTKEQATGVISEFSADVDGNQFFRAKMRALDTQYKYPLPNNYQPPLMSTIDANTKAPILYEHYGNTKIDKNYKRKIGAINLKPTGGLWACAQNDEGQSWYSYASDWKPYRKENKAVFELSPDAKILKIDSIEVIAYLQQHYPKEWEANLEATYLRELFKSDVPAVMVDWEKVSQDYDGIYYSVSALWNSFGCYDVNSLHIFNLDMIIEHERQDVLHFPADEASHILREIRNYLECTIDDNWINCAENLNNDEIYFGALYEVANKLAEEATTSEKFQYYTAISNAALASVTAIQNQTEVPLYDPACISELNAMADEMDLEQNLDEI